MRTRAAELEPRRSREAAIRYNPGMCDLQRAPWWKRKCWIVAAAVWLVIAYPLSIWPAAYLVGRGWLPAATANVAYAPIIAVTEKLRAHPRIGLGPANADGTRPYIVLPDHGPWPRPTASAAEGYLDSIEWFADVGQKHAATP